jgi:hypothetical protein
MSAQTYRILLTILAAALTVGACASLPEPSEARTHEAVKQHLGPLAGLRMYSWSGVIGLTAHRDDWRKEAGYIMFEPGTAKPVASAGHLGTCAKEPAIPAAYLSEPQLACTFADDAAIRIDAYATESETANGVEPESLAAKRARRLENTLESVALPQKIASIETHVTEGGEDSNVSSVGDTVGLRIELSECPGDCDPQKGESHGEARKRINQTVREETPSGPMSWLHRHDGFEPEWKELSTDGLGDRWIVLEDVAFDARIYETTVIVSEEGAFCRRIIKRKPRDRTEGLIFFEPGTASPIAADGAGMCLGEGPFDKDTGPFGGHDHRQCAFNKGSSVALHGYVWPLEGQSTERRRKLGRKRLDVVERYLENSALPDEVDKRHNHGTARTDAPVDGTRPLPGVSVKVKGPKERNASQGYEFVQYTSDPWNRTQLSSFREFLLKYGFPLENSHTFAEAFITLRVRMSDGGTYFDHASIPRDKPALSAIAQWASALVDHRCDVTKAGPPTDYLADDAVPRNDTPEPPLQFHRESGQ